MATSTTTGKPARGGSRLLALDILRGITIAGMILVNNPGSWADIYPPLRHASWNGLTPTDLVFPFFMFIMGVSTYMSLRKYDFSFSRSSVIKILRRTVVIFFIGIFIAWFAGFLRGITGEKTLWDSVFTFDHIRILGVMPRLAICYGLGSLIAMAVPRKGLPWVVAAMLIVYAVILLFGNGYEFSDDNVISIVDHKVLGPNHMYSDTIDGQTLKFDPEGLLSTLPSIAHMLIGFLCGMMICSTNDNSRRINRLFIVGTILTFAGFLLDYGMPINKKIWSPTFVLTTCGLASSLLALLIWIIDIRGHRTWCRFFESFGVNPLFMYCLAAILSIVLARMGVSRWFFRDVLVPLCGDNTCFASLLFAITFVLINWCIGYILYKKKIYIKI